MPLEIIGPHGKRAFVPPLRGVIGAGESQGHGPLGRRAHWEGERRPDPLGVQRRRRGRFTRSRRERTDPREKPHLVDRESSRKTVRATRRSPPAALRISTLTLPLVLRYGFHRGSPLNKGS
jgi:hypothetical protein